MQLNPQFVSYSPGFASPLRVIDQNAMVRAQASPNCLQKYSLSETQRLKRRFTQGSQHQNSENGLVRSIRISYKQNVASQADPQLFSSVKCNSQQHPQGKHQHSVQFQTTTNKANFANKRPLRTVSINPFNLQPSIIEEIYKTPVDKNVETTLKEDDFVRLRELGKGKFGTVWLVRHKVTNFMCAMKVIKKSVVRQEKVEHQVAKQIRIHNTLRHANIINFYGYFHDQEHFYILTQYATGGQVYSLIKKKFRLTEEEVAPIVKETADGLQFMHNLGFIHRDIKPENIILQFGTVKICDLGWAAQCSRDDMRKSICGTPLYYSPEVVRQSEHNALIDVWSLGVLAYQLLVGRIPFKIWSEFDLPVILEQEVSFPDYIDLEEDTKEFILSCLEKSAYLRPNLSSLRYHPFLRVRQSESSLSLYEEMRAIL